MEYAERHNIQLVDELGYGYDGTVVSTTRQTALKALRYLGLYQNERNVYLRLRDLEVFQVRRFNIPKLRGYDDNLWILEMDIVSPPFVLDFAGAYLDHQPDYGEEVYREWVEEKREQFGENWPEVRKVMRELAGHGIYLADVKPGNIEFGRDDIAAP